MNTYTNPQRLIGKKGLELCKAPGVECCALRPSSPHPRTNVRQIFDGNRALRAFGLRNNPLGDDMVGVLGKARLLTCQDFEPAAAAEGAFPLQLVPEPSMSIAHVPDGATAVDQAVTIRGDVGHTEIDPKYIVTVLGVGLLYLTGCQQIPLAAMVDQIGFTHARLEQLHLTFASNKWDR